MLIPIYILTGFPITSTSAETSRCKYHEQDSKNCLHLWLIS